MKPYYQAGGVTLYHGDCLEILDALPHRCGALITDPPFAFTGGISNGRSSEASDQFFTHWWRSVCDKATRAIGADGSGFVWCDWRTAGPIAQGFTRKEEQSYEPWRVSQMLFHYREMPGQGSPFRSSVDMVAYCRGPEHRNPPISASQHNLISSFWRYGKHEHHPSEKSIKLAGMFVDWSTGNGRAVLDPFAGSGTVLLAAKARGIDAVGIEMEEHFCEVIANRCEQGTLELIAECNAPPEGAI